MTIFCSKEVLASKAGFGADELWLQAKLNLSCMNEGSFLPAAQSKSQKGQVTGENRPYLHTAKVYFRLRVGRRAQFILRRRIFISKKVFVPK